MIALERETIDAMRAGRETRSALANEATASHMPQRYPHLSEPQRDAVQQILASRDQVVALEGVAGAGKTTALASIRDAAEREGYLVEGFAPTSRAAQKLADAGIPSSTLQRHLARREAPPDGYPRLYISSLRVSDHRTACCSSATCVNIRPWTPAVPTNSCRKQGSRPFDSTRSCVSRIRH